MLTVCRPAAFLWVCAGLAILAATSCRTGHNGTSSKSQTAPLNNSSALVAIRTRILATPALFQRLEYNPEDPAIVERFIDPAIRKGIEQRYFGRWPANTADVEGVAKTLAASAWRSVMEHPDGRAALEAQMMDYWKNPKVQLAAGGGGMVADLAICPGKLEQSASGSYTVRSCEWEERGELQPAELVRRLEGLLAGRPNAPFYQVNVSVNVHRRDRTDLTYRYIPASDSLEVSHHGNVYSSPSPVGKDLNRLATGQSPVHTNDLRMWTKSTRVGVREPGTPQE